MDLDKDGHKDLVSGSWPGQLFFFQGQKDRTFKAASKLVDKDKAFLKPGSASVIFVADWDSDGDLDLLLGNIQGQISLARNESGGKALSFAKPEPLKAGDKEIKVPHGDSAPVVVDWDGDGRLDLISGAGDGSVQFYRNVGSRDKPKLAAAKALIEKTQRFGADSADKPSGGRSKVCVVDWNKDGRLDLLVGDYCSITKTIKLSEEQAKIAKEFDEKYKVISARYTELYQSKRAAKKGSPELAEINKKIRLLSQKMRQTYAKSTKGRTSKRSSHGFVWLYVQKAKKAELGGAY